MSMFIPKKLVEHKFSYPKRRLNKNTQEINKENEIAEEPQRTTKPDASNINPNVQMKHQEDEDFWVDCNNQIENHLLIEGGENNNPYANSGFRNDQHDPNHYMNYENAHNNNGNYVENNPQDEDYYHEQYQKNNPNFNVNNHQIYNQEARKHNEFNNKYEEEDYNHRNYDNNFVNQSVKNIFPMQDKDANENSNFRGNERSMDNYYQMGAYEKNKDQSYMGDSPNKENRTSFVYDSKKSKMSLNGKNNEVRYLQETMSSRNLKRIYSSQEKDIQTPKKSREELEMEVKRKRAAAEKCFSLYENGKIKNEVSRLLAQKNEEIKRQNELRECTFFPKTNFNDRFIGDKNINNQMLKKLDSNFYERILNWQQKKEKKAQKEKSSLNDNEKYTHMPQINEKNLEEVFSNKSIHNDLHTRNYLNRLDNARREVEEKQKRLKWSAKNAKTGMHFRSSSMGEIDPEMYNRKNENNNGNALNNLKKNLRDELHSMSMLPNESDGEY